MALGLGPAQRDERNLRLWVAQRLKRGDSEAMVPFHHTLEWLRTAWTTLPGVQQQLAAEQLAALVQVARRAGVGQQAKVGFVQGTETALGAHSASTTTR